MSKKEKKVREKKVSVKRDSSALVGVFNKLTGFDADPVMGCVKTVGALMVASMIVCVAISFFA